MMKIAILSDVHGNYIALREKANKIREMGISTVCKADVIVCGHSHVPGIRFCNGKYIINPGSVGNSCDNDNRISLVVADIDRHNIDFKISRLSYDIDLALEAAKREGFPSIDSYAYLLSNESF